MRLGVLYSIGATVALTLSIPLQAAEISGEDVAKCSGLYNRLIINHRDTGDLKNKESWSDKLVFWSVVGVARSGEGKSQPNSEQAKQEIDQIVKGLGNSKTAVTAFLNSGIDRCEGLESQAARYTDSSRLTEATTPAPTYDQLIQCSGLFMLRMDLAVKQEDQVQKYMGKAEDWLVYAGQEHGKTMTELTTDADRASKDHLQYLAGISEDAERVNALNDAERKCDALGGGFVTK